MTIVPLPSPAPAVPSRGLARWLEPTSFAANVVSNYLGRGWEIAMSVAFVPLYIRYLGPEAYGVIGLIAVVQSLMLVLDFGMTPALTREAARYRAGETGLEALKDLVRSVEWVVGGVGVVIVAVLALSAGLIAGHWVRAGSLDTATIARALTIGGALIALRFFESILRGALYGLERQALTNGIAAFFATARAAGAVALIALAGAKLPGFLAWQAATSLTTVVALRIALAHALPGGGRAARFSTAALRSVGRFAIGMVAVSILALAATQADKVVLSRLLSLKEFGYYVFAANVVVALQLASAPLMTALYPRIIALVAAGDEAALIAFFRHWARIVTLLTAPATAMLVFFAGPIILAWSGDPVLAAHSGAILSVLALGTFLQALCVLPYQVQLAYGWTSLAVWTNVAVLSLTIPALLVFAPVHGGIAGAWTWVVAALFYFAGGLSWFFSRHLSAVRWRFFALDVGAPTLAAFLTTALAGLLAPLQHGPIVRFAILALAFALGCAASVAVGWRVQAKIKKGR